MQVTEIIVGTGRTFNHPYETYSNLKPSLTLKATLDPGESEEQAVRVLQAKAERLIDEHKANLLNAIREQYQLSRSVSPRPVYEQDQGPSKIVKYDAPILDLDGDEYDPDFDEPDDPVAEQQGTVPDDPERDHSTEIPFP